jgi:hypothetical protein
MEAFDVRKENLPKLEGGGLKGVVADMFPDYAAEGERIIIRFGAMQPMTVWLENKKLCVEIVTDRNVDNDTALKSIGLRNRFLEAATGFNAKERLKRLKKGEG